MARPKIDIDLDEVERLAALGLSQVEISRSLGISTDTLERRKKDSVAFAEALARGRARGTAKISNALFEQALNGSTRAAIFYLKALAGWSETENRPYAVPPLNAERREMELKMQTFNQAVGRYLRGELDD